MHRTDCELDLPYPATQVSGKNTGYANLLLNNYAGQNGELTAITQYFYQYFIVKPRYPGLAGALECISIVEMRHMETLGELIVLLGGNPLLRTYNRQRSIFWRGSFLSPTQNVRQFLGENIEAERNAIAAYELRIRQIDDAKIREILARIILDEEHHIRLFEKYRADFIY